MLFHSLAFSSIEASSSILPCASNHLGRERREFRSGMKEWLEWEGNIVAENMGNRDFDVESFDVIDNNYLGEDTWIKCFLSIMWFLPVTLWFFWGSFAFIASKCVFEAFFSMKILNSWEVFKIKNRKLSLWWKIRKLRTFRKMNWNFMNNFWKNLWWINLHLDKYVNFC